MSCGTGFARSCARIDGAFMTPTIRGTATARTPPANNNSFLPMFILSAARFSMIVSTLRLRSEPVTPDTQTNGDFR